MAEISAGMVKELRERTGMGMMECKKALTETSGDLKVAEDLLRVRSGAKASKVAGRVAAEGVISLQVSADGRTAAMVEVNCETDFVAKDQSFLAFARNVAETAAAQKLSDADLLGQAVGADGATLEATRAALVMKLGENMTVRRAFVIDAQGKIASYVHGGKIGVLVDVEGGDDTLGKDLAMHIAAAKPVALDRSGVPAESLEREREIARTRAIESGKPENLVDKIADGTVAKYLADVTLLDQPFVKDDKQTIKALLASKSAKVHAFRLFVVGEGIEKKSNDFAAEVAAQAAAAKGQASAPLAS